MKTGQNSSNFRFIFIIGTVYLILACAVMIYLVVDAGLFEKERKELSSKLMKLNNSLSLLQLLIEKGETEGYAPLGSNGIVPESFLPSFVSNVQFNLGCWDAQFNFPQINDGVGINGQTYIVCVPGTTEIDGTSEWFLYDFVVFSSDLSAWIRIDLTKNVLQDAASVQSNDVSLIDDAVGPLFSLSSIQGSQYIDILYDNVSKSYFFDYTGQFTDTTISDATTSGSSLIFDQGPGNMSTKTLVGGTTADVEETPSSINFRLFPSQNAVYNSGTFDAEFSSPVFYSSNPSLTVITFTWTSIGDVYRMTTTLNGGSRILRFNSADTEEQFYQLDIDFSTASDPFFASLNFENIYGQITGLNTGTFNGDVNQFGEAILSGTCQTVTSQTMSCLMTGGELAPTTFIFPNFTFVAGSTGIVFFAFHLVLKASS